MFGKGRGIDQPHTFADRLGFLYHMLPPRTAPERPAGVIVKAHGCKVVRTFPAVHMAKLRTTGSLTVIGGRGPQGATRRAFFVGMVEDIDVLIRFFVLARGIFGGHPVAIAFGVQ